MATATEPRHSPVIIDPSSTRTSVESTPLYRLSVEQYHQLCESAIIPEGSPVELVEGLLVRKMSKNPPHLMATDLINQLLNRLVPEGWYVSIENPVTLQAQQSEPEPDAKLVRGSPRDYAGRKPGPADTPLVIEISDTSYRFDRQVKWLVYAAAGIPTYWIIDLNRRLLEIHTEPGPEGFSSCLVLGPDDEAPLLLEGREVARLRVADLLP